AGAPSRWVVSRIRCRRATPRTARGTTRSLDDPPDCHRGRAAAAQTDGRRRRCSARPPIAGAASPNNPSRRL
ncbi:MAG: hypothetical protein AVDCRST_MAG53-2152, partial [uncultured Solirubrobacteraceae bacterium]